MGCFIHIRPLYFLFYVNKRHCLERKNKIAVCEECLMLRLFWYLDIAIKTS